MPGPKMARYSPLGFILVTGVSSDIGRFLSDQLFAD